MLGTESRDTTPLLDKVKGISAESMAAECQAFAKSSMAIISFVVHSNPGLILQMRTLRTQKIEGTIPGLSDFKAEIPSSSLTRAQEEKERTIREIHKEKHHSTILSIRRQHVVIIWYHTYVESNFLKWYKWTYLQNRNRLTDIENTLMVTKGETWRGGINQGLGINIHTLLYIK